MARKFLYLVAALIVLVIAALFVLKIWSAELTRFALVPKSEFTEPSALAENAYRSPAMWFARPGLSDNPAVWQPEYAKDDRSLLPGSAGPGPDQAPAFSVFFIHPTSYLAAAHWNAPLDDAESQNRARLFLHAMASPFARSGTVWSPRYRQAAFGAFLTEKPEGKEAIDAAYRDVLAAFDQFLAEAPKDRPIVLAGHSQGALHLMHLLHDRVAGHPLTRRIAAAYVIGWPVSIEHDLPQMGLPACANANQSGCVMSWSSFAEPAAPSMVLDAYAASAGLDGKPHGKSAILCSNPLTGGVGGSAPASANLGSLKPDREMTDGELVRGAVPARCGKDGILLIGDPPDLGEYVLPGNNYHVYDIPLFWANLQADAEQRVTAWARAQ